MKKKLSCALLIDDDENCNFFHKRLLIKGNCTDCVEVVHDGRQAINFLRSENDGVYSNPEIIFLDINMPKMNGWEFLEEYKNFEASRKAKIVLVILTTSLNPDDMERSRSYADVRGFKNKFLTKDILDEIMIQYFPDNF
jgi:CheY-like chemotaxis protein